MTDSDRGVYGISVAADMVSMEVQNLRVYERKGLLEPDRTPGGTRLYSQDDVDRLHRIRDLLGEGLNLAGVGKVLELEAEVERLQALVAEVGELRARRAGGQSRSARSAAARTAPSDSTGR
jgi:DNA-binding transcriptional MerR regulator